MKYANSLLVLAALVLAFTLGAQADNTVCTGAIYLVPDGSPLDGVIAGERWFFTSVRAGRSYAIMVDNTGPSDGQDIVFFFGLILDTCAGGAAPGVRFIQTVEPRSVTVGNFHIGDPDGSTRVSFRPSATGDVFFNVLTTISPGSFRIRVEETTLFNPLWSTFGGFETFYRFQNSTNAECSVTLRMINDAGTQVANTTFPIPANSTVPTVFTGPAAQGGLNLANDQVGQAVITHDCPPGAIQVDGFTGRFDLAAPVVLPIKIQTARQTR